MGVCFEAFRYRRRGRAGTAARRPRNASQSPSASCLSPARPREACVAPRQAFPPRDCVSARDPTHRTGGRRTSAMRLNRDDSARQIGEYSEMGRGLYSAIGRWPDADLPVIVGILQEIGAALDRDASEEVIAAIVPAAAVEAVLASVRAIRAFEVRVGERCSAIAEIVRVPNGRAIEFGNRDHLAFGMDHEASAAIVAHSLLALLEALGSVGGYWFTMD